ncbi:Na+/H+ antiporter NhaC family protein [Maridesulfovibrio salexigens]|uniref:Na+/H+ antiporter NhaC n=1 Tax=Maridesulfovibrio salexigens (strain ATCC 14822 / DSM 2638 / NCIMB 8403 / VKM B-1763) TaxID=526222 RepID=C6BV98_MARSD|nr:Na+/H+ antiporter NhaC family protein [Maridesulfovibrio salexigens]ACS80073.1 Na+/H+ antiporter NhaC [Maridesulfovibrio salexigens DSM 2638]
MKQEANGLALAPLALFLVIFIGTGFFLTMNGTSMAFYQLSATVAILPAIAWAIWMGKDKLNDKINIFLRGAGEPGIVTMCMIYLLAGGFASVAKSIGGVESTVNLGLSIVPASMVLPGLFVIAAFIATAMGTSMGTIAAIAPIAVGVAGKTDISSALLMGSVVGGAMFGDNLSMISDTTIAATRTQGCQMSDKFKMNLLIALPAALITIVILYVAGEGGQVVADGGYSLLKVLPYITILVMAVLGVNVFVVLGAGIVFTGLVGFASMDSFNLLTFSQDIYKGFTGMQEILVLSLLVGGLGELIKFHGGITYIINFIGRLTKGTKSTKAGEFSISALSVMSDLCTANNTVAIILTGGMAKEIAESHNVDPRRSASLLDIFSCVVQGIIPYGAQILLAGSISGLSPLEIIGNMHYCFILAVVAVLSILTGFPRIKK